MSYCDKICYSAFRSDDPSFERAVDELMSQLPDDRVILRLVVFGAPENNEQYIEQRDILYRRVNCRLAGKLPVVSYVAQPPLEGHLVMELHSYLPDEGDRIYFRLHGLSPYILIENACGRFLFAGGFQSDLSSTIYRQSQEVFQSIQDLLKQEGFPLNTIIRQWNYVESITACEGNDQHYQMFNNARSECYATVNWKNGYPAATGIGSRCGGVLIDVDAVTFCSDSCFATPIDNKLQVAAHAYSSDVLEEAGRIKTTPKFERAKSMTLDGRSLIYISGTAATRGEESMRDVGVKRQLEITMENISQLIGDAGIRLLRVYLKHPEDYPTVKHCLNAYEDSVDISYLCADVCRNELLIEVEGIAIE